MAEALWNAWLLYWLPASLIGALVGSVIGCSIALWIHRAIQARKK